MNNDVLWFTVHLTQDYDIPYNIYFDNEGGGWGVSRESLRSASSPFNKLQTQARGLWLLKLMPKPIRKFDQSFWWRYKSIT